MCTILYFSGLYLGTSDRGGQTGFHRIKGGQSPWLCGKHARSLGGPGHVPLENFGILELFRLCLVLSWK